MTELARAYGDALYEVSGEQGDTARVRTDLQMLKTVLNDNPEVLALMDSPALRKQERVKVVAELFDGLVHHLVENALKLVAEYGTASELSEAIRQFEYRWDEEHGIMTADVTSAVPLTPEQEVQLTRRLEAMTGKRVRLNKRVDSRCVGGLRLQIGDRQMDGTIDHQLHRMETRMEGAQG